MNRNSYIQVDIKQELLFSSSEIENGNILPKVGQFRSLSPNNCQDFWQLWKLNQDYFYNCCLKWLNGNSHDAEDVMNHAMLKAWNQWTKSVNEIIYPQSWLTKIIYNCCIDLCRKRQQETANIVNIDDVQFTDHPALTCNLGFPESRMLNLEMEIYLRHNIASLPDRLRYPFIQKYCQNRSYADIAQELTLSEENVRKRIQEARRILQKQLRKYLAGEDNTCLNSLSLLNRMIPTVEELQSDHKCDHNLESSISTKSQQEEINYKTTLICLETLPYPCYNSLIHLV